MNKARKIVVDGGIDTVSGLIELKNSRASLRQLERLTGIGKSMKISIE